MATTKKTKKLGKGLDAIFNETSGADIQSMINAIEKYDAEVERWNDFGIEIYELPIGEIPWEMFNCWLEDHFNSNGKDWINWYLWERKSIFTNEVLPCYDENDNELN